MIFILNLWTMKNICFITLILFSYITTHGQNQYPKDYFSPPVDIKIAIAGTFGELRNNHFHSGIDIKTRQKINMPIYASQEGYIKRIKVSSYGFGKALYINHPKGFTTVYAHLEKFSPEIQKRAEKEHYIKEKFEIDFSLNESEILVRKGELIGFSGNTGSSTGPHLHFEIRDTKTQNIINPMLFGLPILDRTKPNITAILIYQKSGAKELFYPKFIKEGYYKINDTLLINQYFNIGIQTFDLLDAAPNKNGVYSIELFVNDTLFYANQMETFSFNETRYINSHIDYAFYQNNGVKIQKCFLDPNNKLSTNKKATNNAIGKNLNEGVHDIKVVVNDSYQNLSTLEFNINLIKEQSSKPNTLENFIKSKQVFEYKDSHCEIYIPNHSLYIDQPFYYEKKIDSIMPYPVYKILDDSIPSHKSFILSIKIDSLEKRLREKAMIARINNNKTECLKSKWKENKIIGKSNKFGAFTIVIDTIKPIIKHYKKNDANSINFEISDELSGIQSFRGEIDNKWILMDYDFKTGILKHDFNTNPDNKNHQIKLIVTDQAGNISTFINEYYR
ncbi:MAG: hypothetical protein CMD26_05040 [Flavobacteriales bacterium]|nr:hypothetical protein [Flavobacteriales bacterium]